MKGGQLLGRSGHTKGPALPDPALLPVEPELDGVPLEVPEPGEPELLPPEDDPFVPEEVPPDDVPEVPEPDEPEVPPLEGDPLEPEVPPDDVPELIPGNCPG